MRRIKHPFLRWTVAVVVIMCFTILLHALYYVKPRIYDTSSTYHIHFVNYRGRTDVDAGFEQHLKSNNVRYTITYHDLALDPTKADEVRRRIEADPSVDLIVTSGTASTLGVIGRHDVETSERISRIPTIFTLVTNPEGAEVIASRFAPRTNVTGSSHIAPPYNQFRTMMAYHPAKRIGVIFTPSELNSVLSYTAISYYAQSHGVEVVAMPFLTTAGGRPDGSNAAAAVATLKAQGVEWLYLPPDSFLGSQVRDHIIPAAHAAGIRTFASTEQQMQAGAAYGLISPYTVIGQHAAEQAVRILVEKVPAHDIPIDSSPRFIHQVNADALARLNLPLPDHLSDVQVLTNR